MLIFDDQITRIHRLVLGPIKTNAYIVQANQRAFLLDPSGEPEKLHAYLKTLNIPILFSAATHGHFDHLGAAANLIEAEVFPHIYVHPLDQAEVQTAHTMSLLIAKKRFSPPATKVFSDDFYAQLAEFGFEVAHCPGHTPGSCIFYRKDRKILFPGDLIVHNLITNLKTNSRESRQEMLKSIEFIRSEFDGSTLIFPGHGTITRLEIELKFNKKIRWMYEQ